MSMKTYVRVALAVIAISLLLRILDSRSSETEVKNSRPATAQVSNVKVEDSKNDMIPLSVSVNAKLAPLESNFVPQPVSTIHLVQKKQQSQQSQ